MQLKFFNWEAQDSGQLKENGSEQDRNGPWPHSASSIFGIQRKKVIESDSGRPVSGSWCRLWRNTATYLTSVKFLERNLCL